MIEYKRNGQNVKERGTIATEWTPSPLDSEEVVTIDPLQKIKELEGKINTLERVIEELQAQLDIKVDKHNILEVIRIEENVRRTYEQ